MNKSRTTRKLKIAGTVWTLVLDPSNYMFYTHDNISKLLICNDKDIYREILNNDYDDLGDSIISKNMPLSVDKWPVNVVGYPPRSTSLPLKWDRESLEESISKEIKYLQTRMELSLNRCFDTFDNYNCLLSDINFYNLENITKIVNMHSVSYRISREVYSELIKQCTVSKKSITNMYTDLIKANKLKLNAKVLMSLNSIESSLFEAIVKEDFDK